MRFRPDIEGLRAVAIILVVLYHAGWRHATGGFLGVDVFFVLSGFLITGLLIDEVAKTGTLSLRNFWARRARRLLPAAAAITIIVVIANAVILSPFEQIRRADSARAFAVYGSNILFAVRSTDYFGGTATRDPLLHTWSLSVEEQFYLVFAPLVLATAVWLRSRGYDVFRRRFAIATIVLSVVSLGGCVYLVRAYPTIAFYVLPTRAWEFGLGALAALGIGRVTHRGGLAADLVALASLAAMIASAKIVKEGQPLGLMTLLPTLGTVGLILTGATERPTLVARVFSTPPMRLIGRLSYSWYLWHWPVLVYLRERVPDASFRLNVAAAALSLAPAAITYQWLESPIRFSRRLQQYATAVIVGAVVLASATYGIAAGADSYANRTLASPRYAGILASRQKARVYADGCQVPLLASVSPPCVYGPGTNDTTLVLFGDSHAAHWFPAFDSVVTLRGWKLVNLTKTGCPSLQIPLNNLGRRYVECDAWREVTIRRIVDLRPTLVVLANERSYDVIVGAQLRSTDSSGLARREWSDGLSRSLTALAPSRARLIVLEDTPQAAYDIPRCLVKYIDEPARCDLPVRRALGPLVAGSEMAAVRAHPGALYMSLNPFLCDATTCPVSRDGLVRYQDSGHLTVTYAASLAPVLSQVLTRTLAEAGGGRK